MSTARSGEATASGDTGGADDLIGVLLIEPQFVLRRTIAAVARDLRVVDIHEATSLERALPLLTSRAFDGLIIDIGPGRAALDALERLRRGNWASRADIPVIALTPDRKSAAEEALAPFGVLSVLQKPFKIGDLLQLLASMKTRHRSARSA